MPRIQGVPSLSRDPLNSALLAKSRTKRDDAKLLLERTNLSPPLRNDILPPLEITLVAISDIKVAKRRLRLLSKADVQEIANSIAKFGFSDPILISKSGTLVDGESRLQAAIKLGLTHVPCIRVGHMNEEQARAFRVASNRIGTRRSWDIGELRLEMSELDGLSQPIDLLGFRSIELDQIMAVEEPPSKPKKAKAQSAEVPVTQKGDLWALGGHLLFCGDATDPQSYETVLGDQKAQLVLTDPPYNVKIASIVSTDHAEFVQGSGEMSDSEFDAFLAAFLVCCHAVLVDGGIVFSFMDWKHIDQLIGAGKASGYDLLALIVWVKETGGMGSLYRSQHELVPAFKKPGTHKNNIALGKNGRDRTNCWFEAGANTPGSEARAMLGQHPTSKPPKLLMDAMLDVTDRGDIVLDPFGGSGSTLIAAHRTKRMARLIELDPLYCDVILRRWLAETQDMPIHVGSGESFDEREKTASAAIANAADTNSKQPEASHER